jgi:SAM-dependent methyltransferase
VRQSSGVVTLELGGRVEAYAPIAAFYDLEHDQFDDDIEWSRHLAEVAGSRVLELGCGSGRILGPLAAAGNQVVGVDSSSEMLQRARSRLQSAIARGDVALFLGDMQQIAEIAPGPFDLVIIALNGFLHLDGPDAQQLVLSGVRRILRPGGLLAIDALHAVPDALNMFDGRVVHEGSWDRSESVISKFSARTVDWTNQLIESEVWYDEVGVEGVIRRHRTEFPMRWVTPSEISLMLEMAGFVDLNLAGSYDGSPLTDMSDRMLVVARSAEAG